MEGLESYKYHLIRQGKRQGTIEKHLHSLRLILKCVNSLAMQDAERYIFALFEKGRSPGYLNVIIQALRSYGEFKNDPSYKKIKYFKVLETHKGTLSDSEIERLLAIDPANLRAVNKENFNIYTVFFTILAYTGCRPGEVAKLSTTQVDFGNGVIHLFNDTKTSTPRTVPLNPMLVPTLERYIRNLKTEKLFPRINHDAWKDQFNMRIRYLGIKREKLSTYSLRHSLITRLIEEDVALQKVMKIVGHKRIETTFHYTHLTKKDVIKAISKDRLGRKSLSVNERILQARKALEDIGFIVIKSHLQEKGFIFECLED